MMACENLSKSYGAGHSRRQVLKGINLVVGRGERVAVLGRNGAGKSTLIKQIGGVELPDSGRVVRKMSISWPLGFNGGFQGSLTGYDNARFIARIYGISYPQTKAFVEEFTELGSALANPVKTYSSGMRFRLAFALSLAIEFDCYLIDEVIIVGDQNFQQKCVHELFEKRSDRAMLVASHDMTTIRELCTRAVIIHDGHLVEYCNMDEAIEAYSLL